MIPKVIHYCWFGRNEKPLSVKKCIDSWKTYCADYLIVEWNEDNFEYAQNDYAREAYEAKKWAFVTDFARLWIVYNYGGIYLDTDVELIKPFDDMLDNKAFFGLEDTNYIATGLGFGAEKRNPIVKMMLNDYDSIRFKKEDGSFDELACPLRNTRAIKHLLPKDMDYDVITTINHARIYPKEYFCPLSADGSIMKKTQNTHSIHWFTASWLSEEEKVIHDYRVFRNKCELLFGNKIGSLISRSIYLFKPRKRKILKGL